MSPDRPSRAARSRRLGCWVVVIAATVLLVACDGGDGGTTQQSTSVTTGEVTPDDGEPDARGRIKVDYEVVGTVDRVELTYDVAPGEAITEAGVELPVSVDAGTAIRVAVPEGSLVRLRARNPDRPGIVTCSIRVGGTAVSSQTAPTVAGAACEARVVPPGTSAGAPG